MSNLCKIFVGGDIRDGFGSDAGFEHLDGLVGGAGEHCAGCVNHTRHLVLVTDVIRLR